MINHPPQRFNLILRSHARLLAITGFIVLLGSTITFLMNPSWTFLIQIGTSAGIVLILFAIILRPNALYFALMGRRVRYASSLTVVCLAFGTILAIVNILSFKHNFEFDLTETGEFTLSEQTITVLENLSEPVQVVGFFGPDDWRWAKTREYLERYSRFNDLITYELHDPNNEASLVQSYGLDNYGLVFLSGVYDYEVSKVDEQAITTGLMCVTTHKSNQECVELVPRKTRYPTDRHFSLTLFQTSLIFFIALVFIPLMSLIAGLRIWWVRR